MSWITTVRDKIKLQEGSTKRGISAVITGMITLYLIFKGQPADVDALLSTVSGKVEFWIGVGLNVMGLLGIFLPDEPKTIKIELPKIELPPLELQGKATQPVADVADHEVAPSHSIDPAPRLRASASHEVSPKNKPQIPTPSVDSQSPGWNG